ncbi:ABC transporter substrate-binding protein [Cognatiyoonia sp. IB215182]|uniref:ABC transporter substrate-binding protein n=1 Tax=Cognatiyoonia sp. IB215182 TaxID=3097353 RepID=UPI002A13426E|nr:ABC transporter substrate-binding protein [Cognatiyoonia sp. IB215182]MDX8352601.1 ABC transporter substrate-binding protein [Cognatiyoonia sp. IB215182]
MTLRSMTASAALLIGFTAPALAQENLCGGSGANGQWIGGDEASSDIATADNFQEQMALVLGGNEYVSLFSLSEGAEVRMEAAGRGSGDPVIDILDASGSVVISDDDSGGNGASRAETFLDAGTYCVAVRSYDGGPMTAFVRVGRQDQQPLTEGINVTADAGDIVDGSCETATPMGGLGSSATGSANETPFWQFTLDEPAPVRIRAENETADPLITLYGPGEVYIDENDDFDGLNAQLSIVDPLDAGTYCLGVEALSDGSAPITVSVDLYDPEAALADLYARGEAAPSPQDETLVTPLGVLEGRLRQDVQASTDVTWFSIEMPENGLMLVEAVGTDSADSWLVLFDDLGRQIAQNDDYGDGLDSLIAARVPQGTYLIGVRLYEGSQGFVRVLAERYVTP